MRKALRLAISMDTMAYESDLYDYRDRVEDREEFVLGLQQDLLGDKETVFGIVEWFQELVDEETNEAEDAQRLLMSCMRSWMILRKQSDIR